MRTLTLAAALAVASAASAQNTCGDQLSWADPVCQQLAAGTLGPNWSVVSRHGEYAQSETECNVPQAVAQAPGAVTITTTAAASSCGNFNANGTVDTAAASWPYTTGDIQFASFNFSPGGAGGSANCLGTCNVTVVGKMPASDTGLWPAFWLLGSNCQDSNKWSGDTGFDGCPDLGASGYTEIDTTECYGSGWCQFHVANPSFGIGNGCDAVYAVDTSTHVFKTVWTASKIEQYLDGTKVTTCNESLTNPMFFIAQIQTGGAGGTPNDNHLPASLVLNSVKITDANGGVLFFDDFGADGGTPDAGAPDSGAPDAGAPDAGPPDAGAADAGHPGTDGGTTPDGGTMGSGASGCSCRGSTGTQSWIVLVALLGLSRRRHQRAR